MLAAMFSGLHGAKPDENGRYFIDRDGTHFRYILNYLRDRNTFIPADNQQVIEELYCEVKFYQIRGLDQKLEAIMENTGTTPITYKTLLKLINYSKKPLQLPKTRFSQLVCISYLDFTKASMQACDFSGCQLIEVNFTGCNLARTNFRDTFFQNSVLREANLDHADFTNSNISGIDMGKTSLRNAIMVKAKMMGTDLRGSDMQGASLQEANLLVANLENASLFLANLKNTTLDRANLKGVKGYSTVVGSGAAGNGGGQRVEE